MSLCGGPLVELVSRSRFYWSSVSLDAAADIDSALVEIVGCGEDQCAELLVAIGGQQGRN
jgi:hypothetical protein